MATYNQSTITRTYHLDFAFTGPLSSFTNALAYTCPPNTRAKVFLELAANISSPSSHGMFFRHKRYALSAIGIKKSASMIASGGINGISHYDDGDRGRYGYSKFQTEISNPYFSFDFAEALNTFDLAPGDTVNMDSAFIPGSLPAGHSVVYRLRIEEIGPS